MYEIDGRSFCVHPFAAYESHRAMFHQGDSQIAQNIRCWARPLSTKTTCRSERRDTHCLWKCFKTIPRYMIQMGGAFDSICPSIIGPIEPFSTKAGSQIACKMPHFGYLLSTENWMLNCNERQPLSMKYFKTFLRGIKQVG